MNKKIFLLLLIVIFLIILNYYNYFTVALIIYSLTLLEFGSGFFLLFSSQPSVHNKILSFYRKISFINNDYAKALTKNFQPARKLFGKELMLNAIFVFSLSIDFLLRLLPLSEVLQENKTSIALAVKLPVLIFYIPASIYISAKIKKLSSDKISDDSPWKL